MGQWAVLLLSIALCAPADDTLYDALKTASVSKTQRAAPFDFSVDGTPFMSDERGAKHLQPPWMKEPFRRLDEQQDYLSQTINANEETPYRYRVVIEDSLYLQLVMLSSLGVLSLMPQSVTGWDEEELRAKSLETRWKENVSKRPVWDKDDFLINYIGHPVAGGWYYMMARNDGMSITESAVFSTILSTFFWEYGYEAFAEVPSIQDLIVTPLGGALLGEWMYRLERKLDANGGTVFGSPAIGNISYFFLDPLGRIADGIKEVLRRGGMTPEVTMSIRTYPRAPKALPIHLSPQEPVYPGMGDYGFVITFQ